MPLLHPRPDTPHLDTLTPRAAIPGGSFDVTGLHLLHPSPDTHLPYATFGETEASLDVARATRARIRVPNGAISSDLALHRDGLVSNILHANVGVPMAEELHLVANPAVDADNNLFAMVSGPRGDRVPVSIFRIDRDLQIRPFARDLLNVSALAFGPLRMAKPTSTPAPAPKAPSTASLRKAPSPPSPKAWASRQV